VRQYRCLTTGPLQHIATLCNTLYRTATHCTARQHTHFATMQVFDSVTKKPLPAAIIQFVRQSDQEKFVFAAGEIVVLEDGVYGEKFAIYNFAKDRNMVIVYSQIHRKLLLRISTRWRCQQRLQAKVNFLKVSLMVILCSRVRSVMTFENFWCHFVSKFPLLRMFT